MASDLLTLNDDGMFFITDTQGAFTSSTTNQVPKYKPERKPKQTKPRELGEYIKRQQPDVIRSKVDDLMKKSILQPGFDTLTKLPPVRISERSLKALRKKDRALSKGKDWFGMRAPEVTDEVKRDLEALQMRSVLDPKQFYKKNDMKVLPKYFQFGKVMDSPLDYYNNRLTKKQRKQTLVDELLANVEFKKYNKRKYKEIIEERRKTQYRAYRKGNKDDKKKVKSGKTKKVKRV